MTSVDNDGFLLVSTVHINSFLFSFPTQCLTAYVSFEVLEAAYDIACPDATCEKQGVLSLVEIEALAPTQLMEKHKKFRLYKGKPFPQKLFHFTF